MYEIYNIKDDDSLDKIANQYGTTVEMLMQINGIKSDYEMISGDLLIVPSRQHPYQYYTVKKGDTIYDIAKKNNINYAMLLQLNGLDNDDYIYPNQTIMLPKEGVKVYLTKENDTIDDILKFGNITLEELVRENTKIYLRPEQIIIFKEK